MEIISPLQINFLASEIILTLQFNFFNQKVYGVTFIIPLVEIEIVTFLILEIRELKVLKLFKKV